MLPGTAIGGSSWITPAYSLTTSGTMSYSEPGNSTSITVPNVPCPSVNGTRTLIFLIHVRSSTNFIKVGSTGLGSYITTTIGGSVVAQNYVTGGNFNNNGFYTATLSYLAYNSSFGGTSTDVNLSVSTGNIRSVAVIPYAVANLNSITPLSTNYSVSLSATSFSLSYDVVPDGIGFIVGNHYSSNVTMTPSGFTPNVSYLVPGTGFVLGHGNTTTSTQSFTRSATMSALNVYHGIGYATFR